MSTAPNLRISAKKAHELLFSQIELRDFIYWCGYLASQGSNSTNRMSKTLAGYCAASPKTIYRWTEGSAKPNGTNMLMIYGGVMADYFDGDQNRMVEAFLDFHNPKLKVLIFQ